MRLKIASWNVNSIRARLENVMNFIQERKVDILCLQETKVEDGAFPEEYFRDLGYKLFLNGTKRFNGVCIASKVDVSYFNKDLFNDYNKHRLILVKLRNNITILNAYFPNGQTPQSEQFQYKLKFMELLKDYIDSNFDAKRDFVILVGDFNVALEERDVYDPINLDGKIGFHPQERSKLRFLKSWGFVDVLRVFNNSKVFSWWDYRNSSFRKNEGMRLDYIWVSDALKEKCIDCFIDKTQRTKEKPSDHAPVYAEIEI